MKTASQLESIDLYMKNKKVFILTFFSFIGGYESIKNIVSEGIVSILKYKISFTCHIHTLSLSERSILLISLVNFFY